MPKQGHKLSEYMKLPAKKKRHEWAFNMKSVDPLVKKKDPYDTSDRHRD